MQKGDTFPVLDDIGFVRYIDHMGDDKAILEAARVSYSSHSKGEEADKKLLAYLFKNKHSSPFEMVKVKIQAKMPIFVMRQYIRHRMQNVNEFSARYKEMPDDFYVPATFRRQDTSNKQGSVQAEDLDHRHLSSLVSDSSEQSYRTYKRLLALGVAREQARIVLPIGIYTEFYACWDMNNLIKFFTLRDDNHAQEEHRAYAEAIKTIARSLFPWTMALYDELKGAKS